MPRRFIKYKLLLDEGFPVRSFFPRLNSRFDLKHIAADYNKSGLSDILVYNLAIKEERLIVTFNVKDFENLVKKSNKTGVIGVSANLSNEQIDKKLTSYLIKHKPRGLFGKFVNISGET